MTFPAVVANEYLEGELIRLEWEYDSAVTESGFIDPDVVILALLAGDNASWVRYPYGQEGSPVMQDSEGHYHADIDSTGHAGTWVYVGESTGVGQSAGQKTLQVIPNPSLP